uniref:Uncharacterized protein n=1 Tax=Leersia perrieri TaxID=77586 RepID=A0A0D9V226_9ORYZ
MSSLEALVEALRGGNQWSARQPFTIFRVPAYVRESNRTAYEPRMVSIGPYYHGTAALRPMEDHKWRSLNYFVSHYAGFTASTLVAEMRDLEAQALACYSERPVGMSSDQFIQMLLLDGSFILEFFFKWHKMELDTLIGSWRHDILSDLLLIENQIPFFVLERLWNTVTCGQGGRALLLEFLFAYIGGQNNREPITLFSGDRQVHHLLQVNYECFVPTQPDPKPAIELLEAGEIEGCAFVQRSSALRKLYECCVPKRTTLPSRPTTRIPPATELFIAGVTFVRDDATENMFDRRSGVMKIPTIRINDEMRTVLVNLITFEQTQCREETGLLTSYQLLMSNLIVTARDVQLLRQCGVLQGREDNNDEAARFFSRIAEGATVDLRRQAFAVLFEHVSRYCDSRWYYVCRKALLELQPVEDHLHRGRHDHSLSYRYADLLHRSNMMCDTVVDVSLPSPNLTMDPIR